MGFPGGSVVKNPCAVQEPWETWFDSWHREDPLEEGTATHSSIPVFFLPAESQGQKSLAGYSPQGCKELDMTEVT